MILRFIRKHQNINLAISSFISKSRFLSQVDPQFMLSQQPKFLKRTKMINTIGPVTAGKQKSGQLIDNGMNTARFNMAFGSHQKHLSLTNGVRQAIKERQAMYAAILLDTKGPQIRTGNNQQGKSIFLKKGQLLQLTTDYNHLGNQKRIACSYKDLLTSTSIGRKILLKDGDISSVVKSIQNGIVTVQILNDGEIGQKKNMCLPGSSISLPTIGEADRFDIVQFGLKNKVDFIAVSFARKKKDLDDLRAFLKQKDPDHGPKIQIISKLENRQAILNLNEIISGSDGIMVARGDLGMQIPVEKVVILQKYIMDLSLTAGKYTITSTQMLQSMQSKPRPTRAEISDITNSAIDLSDAVMTSAETTTGQFPIQCANMMTRVLKQCEHVIDYKKIFGHRRKLAKNLNQAVGIVSLSFELQCDLIFLTTDNLKLIQQISSLRPKAYICVFTDKPELKFQTALNFGVYCFSQEYSIRNSEFLLRFGHLMGLNRANILHISTNLQGRISKIWFDSI